MAMVGNVTICAPMRDAGGYLDRFVAQVRALDWPPANLRVVVCEGDSVDDTRERLSEVTRHDARWQVVYCDTGRPHYPSVVNAERFEVLARVFNAALAAVDLAWSDAVLFLPGDILFERDLLRRLAGHGVDIVAPLVFQDRFFYDIWAFSRGGVDFQPFMDAETAGLLGSELVAMDTVGGAVLIAARVLRAGVRYSPVNVDRGLCEAARGLGFGVWCDPGARVGHPRRA